MSHAVKGTSLAAAFRSSSINTLALACYLQLPACRMADTKAPLHQCQLLLQEWIDTTAEFLKSLDSNHLVTVGSEGFLGSSTPGKSHYIIGITKHQLLRSWQHAAYVDTAVCYPLWG